ncbi:sporulation protein YjcZ [Ammoniphilus oxalaticus]|nr:sporulation protein YjcZ [Ammoniphilus oxalaticus]
MSLWNGGLFEDDGFLIILVLFILLVIIFAGFN